MRTPFFFLLFFVAFMACKKDENRICRSCSSDQTPPFELCRESDGNASVNGQDTGTDYDQYLEDLQDSGISCGG